LNYIFQISELASLGIGLDVGTQGIQWKILLNQDDQIVSLPIQITDRFDLRTLFWTTFIPLTLFSMVKYVIVNPWQKRKFEKQLHEQRVRNFSSLAKEREQAFNELQDMMPKIKSNREAERNRNGLVILEAKYGNLHVPATDEKSSPCITVTDQLQFYVKNSKLDLPAHPKSILNGFYDPCPGEEKTLSIRYEFKGQVFNVVVKDRECVSLPHTQ
jgi:DnaJ family protein C protein 11